jgi:hypothetical protein
VCGINPERQKIFHRSFAKQIVANLGDHRNICAAQPRRHRLVSALPAKSQVEALSENSFPRAWKGIAESRQIGISTANNRNAGQSGHSFSSKIAPRSYNSKSK